MLLSADMDDDNEETSFESLSAPTLRALLRLIESEIESRHAIPQPRDAERPVARCPVGRRPQ